MAALDEDGVGGILQCSEEGTTGLEFYSVLGWEGVEEASQIILWVLQKAAVFALAEICGFLRGRVWSSGFGKDRETGRCHPYLEETILEACL